MDIDAVVEGLATNVRTNLVTVPRVTALSYMAESIPEPAFVVGEVDIKFDTTFGRGMDQFLFTTRALVSHADDRSTQKFLNSLLKGSGPTSLKAAIEADTTLGGACDDLHVQSVRGRRLYQWGSTEYVGCELVVLVIGTGA